MYLPSQHHFLSLGQPYLRLYGTSHCWLYFPHTIPDALPPPLHPSPAFKVLLPLLPSAASSKHLLIPSAGSNLSFLQPPHFPLDTFTRTTLFFGYFPLSTFNFCYIFTFYLSYMCLNSLRAGSGLETSFYSPII